jgi:hypothetical protein
MGTYGAMMALAGPWVRSAMLSHVSSCFPSSLAAKKVKELGICQFLWKYVLLNVAQPSNYVFIYMNIYLSCSLK